MKKQKKFTKYLVFLFTMALITGFLVSGCKKESIQTNDDTEDQESSEDTTEVTVTPEVIYKLDILSGNGQEGEVEKVLSQKLKIRIMDQNGNGKAGVTVKFEPDANDNGSAEPSGTITDGSGMAAVNWKLGKKVGQQKMNVRAEIEGKTLYATFAAKGKLRPCIVEEKPFTPSPITFIPPHTNGNTDFSGNGPQVNANVSIYIEGNTVKAKIYMKARETKHDWTTAEGSFIRTIYTAPPNRKIVKIIGPTSSAWSYLDTNHQDDVFYPGGLVSKFVFTGDVHGPEAGTKTKVVSYFNTIKVQLKEVGNCN